MKRWVRQLAAGAAVTVALASHSGALAQADEPPSRLIQEDCRAFTATPEADLVGAWHLQRLGMDSVWKLATGKGVKVAVIDTGVSTLGSAYLDGPRFTVHDMLGGPLASDEDGLMDCSHGTSVVSLLAAGRGSDGAPLGETTNFAGIAPDVEVIAYRTLASSGDDPNDADREAEDLSATISAVRLATAEGVDVINLSQVVGDNDLLDEYQAAVQAALDAGIVVVAAAGNTTAADQSTEGSPRGLMYPASFPGVIAVGISNEQDAGDPATYPGPTTSIGAPGKDLMALLPSRDQQAEVSNQSFTLRATGTSFAAPIVSGVVALMIEYERDVNGRRLTPEEVLQRLVETADPPASRVPDPFIGHGIINPLRALTGLTPGAASTTSPTPTPSTVAPVVTQPADPRLPLAGLAVGIGAVFLVGLGLVAAIAIPAATRADRRP